MDKSPKNQTQGRWEVVGADARTGQELSVILCAKDENTAADSARQLGLFLTEVREFIPTRDSHASRVLRYALAAAIAVCIFLALSLIWMAIPGDNWERDNQAALGAMHEEAVRLEKAGEDGQALRKVDALLALVGDRQISGETVKGVVSSTRQMKSALDLRIEGQQALEREKRAAHERAIAEKTRQLQGLLTEEQKRTEAMQAENQSLKAQYASLRLKSDGMLEELKGYADLKAKYARVLEETSKLADAIAVAKASEKAKANTPKGPAEAMLGMTTAEVMRSLEKKSLQIINKEVSDRVGPDGQTVHEEVWIVYSLELEAKARLAAMRAQSAYYSASTPKPAPPPKLYFVNNKLVRVIGWGDEMEMGR